MKKFILKSKLLSVLIFISPLAALAQTGPQGITLEGNILNASSLPEEAASVSFTIQIKSPGVESCVLYQESQTLNMANSGGVFSLSIGNGARPATVYEGTNTLKNAFNNASGPLAPTTCANGSSYTPLAGDKRLVMLTFDDGSGAQSITQALDVQTVPYAMYADSVQGRTPTDLIQVNTTTKAVSQANIESVFDTNADVTALVALINGTSTLYAQPGGSNAFTGAVSFTSAPTTSAAPTTSTSIVNKTYADGSIAGKAIDSTTLSLITAGTLPAGDVLSWNGTNWAASPSSDSTKLPLTGGTMTGAIAMGNQNITGTGYITMSAGKYLGLGSYDDTAEGTLVSSTLTTGGIAYKGVTWFNTTSNTIKYWDGATVIAVATGGSAISNLNGLTTSSQSFAIGTSGTSPVFSSLSSTHTLNIPLASTASVTAGLLSNADYATFNKSILKDGTVAFTADQSMGSHKLTSVTDPASAQDAATKNYADTKIAAKAVAGAVSTSLTGSAGNGFVLTWDQSGNQWTALAPASSGTVTSVALTLPSIFAVAGSPVTSSGTLSATLANAGQNAIFAGPSTGGAGTPAFRGLASSDLPTVPVAKGGTGATSLTPNGILMADGTGSSVSSPVCGNGMGYVSNGTSFSCTAIPSSTTGFVNGGNSFGANATLGTSDAYSLGLITNGTAQMTITSAGNVGIGTATPSVKLEAVTAGSGQVETLKLHNTTGAQVGGADITFYTGYQQMSKISSFQESSGTGSQGAMSFFTRLGDVVGEKMRITSAGNVGIGTTAPNFALDVNAPNAFQVAQFSTNYDAVLKLFGSGGSSRTGIMYSGRNYNNPWLQYTGDSDQKMYFRPTNNVNDSTPSLMVLDGLTGNVGVATSNPTSTLQINGTANATTFLMNGSATAEAAKVTNAAEVVSITSSAATGTINFYVASGAVQYYTASATGNFTVNWAWSAGTSLNTALAIGDSITTVFLVTQGPTAYYPNTFKIDGTTIVPKWQGGVAPTSGDASSIDAYTSTIIKTASGTFTVLCAATPYK